MICGLMMADREQITSTERADLREITKRLDLVPTCADLWVTKARLLMLDDQPAGDKTSGLEEVERCILRALELEPKHLEALEEAAHFYDAIVPDRDKAIMYAQHYIRIAGRVANDMREIIDTPNFVS